MKIRLAFFFCGIVLAGAIAAASRSAFDVALDAANERMHHAMMHAPRTGEPDRDFVEQMIPHHQGAIDMARALLMNGHDKELQQLAKSIITDQQNEIQLMRIWLKKHPRPSAERKEKTR